MLQTMMTFLKGCSLLEDVLLTADFLGDDSQTVSVQALPCEPVLRRHADGGSVRQFQFRISNRVGQNVPDGSTWVSFYQGLSDWLESGENLPLLGKGQVAHEIEVRSCGALEARGYGDNRYGMDCRLIYYQM